MSSVTEPRTISLPGVRHTSSKVAYQQVNDRYGDREVDDAVAVTIAGMWASSGSLGRNLAALATGAVADLEGLLGEIATNRSLYVLPDSLDAHALDMLATWAIRKVNDRAVS